MKESHPNIVRYLGKRIAGNTIHIFMEFYMECLSRKIDKKRDSGQRFTLQEIIQFSIQIAKGLVHLHSSKPPVIHRDLKGSYFKYNF
jgi:serine/threonine protein kinase